MKGKGFREKLVAALGALFMTLSVAGQGQPKPDLVVSGVKVETDAQGFVSAVTVKVTNVCRESAPGSYVLVNFKQSAVTNSKTIMFIGNSVHPLKGSESAVQTFPITEMKIGLESHIVVEVDPYNKVAEANEDNNWWKLNPDSKPSPPPNDSKSCSPKM